MTTTYDPKDAAYFDEADLREELLRVYDLCHGCRLCWNLCPSFPSLFRFVDGHDGDVGALTIAEQDQVVDECYQCKLCYVKCPYVPPHEWQLDFPRLMLRAAAVKKKKAGLRERVTDNVLGRTDLTGRIGSLGAPVMNRVNRSPGSAPRRVMEKVLGISADRLLPPYARQRFSTWFKDRPTPMLGRRQASVAIFPTCLVEYQATDVGKDLVKVYERNGVACTVPDGTRCCGAPFLHAGDFDNFEREARQNVEVLAQAVRDGNDIVVPQPTCGYVLKQDYVDYLGETEATRLVKEHTYDAAEYLMRLHRGEGTELDTEFPGEVPATVTYHVPCHLQAQNIGLKSRDLMKLTGAKISLSNRCSGIDGMWGYRAEHHDEARQVVEPLARDIEQKGSEVVAGDCHLANGAIEEATGRRPVHPIQLVARAYGIPEE